MMQARPRMQNTLVVPTRCRLLKANSDARRMPEHREESVVSVKNSDANPGKRHIADLATS
jgi:hypothetical protein